MGSGRAGIQGGTGLLGQLTFPASGVIYVDAQIAIYSTDRHPLYGPVCEPIWKVSGSASVISSELILLESLVGRSPPQSFMDSPVRY